MIDLYPDEPKYLRSLIWVLFQLGKDNEAAHCIEKLTTIYKQKGYYGALESLKHLQHYISVGGIIASDECKPFLSGINPEAIHLLMKHADEVYLNEGETLIQQGDRDDSMYIILDGELAVLVRYEHHEEMTLIHILREGDIVGEMAFFEKHARSASVIANTQVRLLKLSVKCVVLCMLEFPDVGEYLCQESEVRNRLMAINGNPTLMKLPHGAKYELAQISRLVHYPAFSKLSNLEWEETWVGVLVSGLVWVLRKEAVSENSYLEKISSGQMIGDFELFHKDMFVAGLMTVGDVDVLQMDEEKFKSIVEHYALVQHELIEEQTIRLLPMGFGSDDS